MCHVTICVTFVTSRALFPLTSMFPQGVARFPPEKRETGVSHGTCIDFFYIKRRLFLALIFISSQNQHWSHIRKVYSWRKQIVLAAKNAPIFLVRDRTIAYQS